MLMEELNSWKIKNNMFGCEVDEDCFSIFYQEQSCGKTFFEMLYLLAYQIYQLQECVEGLLEDQDCG
jgi:hypothetical protein